MSDYVQQHPVARIKLWVKVFIPGQIPSLTKVVNSGVYRGKTYIEHPMLDYGYLTDQRSFSSDIQASARATSIATLDLGGIYPTLSQSHYSDPTHEVDLDNGEASCTQVASTWTQGMVSWAGKFDWIRLEKSPHRVVRLTMQAAAANPCSPASQISGGLLDYRLNVNIDLSTMRLECTGFVDQVPAYEMYAQLDNRVPIPVFRIGPAAGKSFDSLIGPANRPVRAVVALLGSPHCLDGTLYFGPQPEFCPGVIQ